MDDEEAGPLVRYAKNSLFVKNLSPQVTETLIREVFGQFDEIEKVTFRAFPNSNTQFFAQLDFKTSKGVAEGSKLSGTNILGVPCACGVIDPVASQRQLQAAAATESAVEGAPAEEDLAKRVREAAEEQRMRTVHVAGLLPSTTGEVLTALCEKFGPVERLRVEADAQGAAFGLVEFKEPGPAHLCKMQRNFIVEGRVLVFTEAKSMVDESVLTEQTVQFQAPIRDAMNMRAVLLQQPELNQKLKEVMAVAKQVAGAPAEGDEDIEARRRRKKKDKKKEKDKEKKEKDKKTDKKNERTRKKRRKEETPRAETEAAPGAAAKPAKRRRRPEGAGAPEEESSEVESVGESPAGPVDLDPEQEVEVVANTEMLVLGTSSSSSSSEDEAAGGRGTIASSSASPGRRGAPPREALPLASLLGRWGVAGDGGDGGAGAAPRVQGVWTMLEGGRALWNGRAVDAKWGLGEEEGRIFSRSQRGSGWELDAEASGPQRLVWRKAGEAKATVWLRQPEAPAAAAGGAAVEASGR